MTPDPLNATLELLESNPRSGAGLVLYALVKTLSSPRGQYMFLLNKLRDLDENNRQLAYGLMEVMVAKGNETPEWEAMVARMDAALRG